MAKNSFGSFLYIGPAGGSLVKIASVDVTNPPEITRGMIDTTTHDSADGAAEGIPEGVYSVGVIEAQGNYISRSTDDTAIMGYITDGTLVDVKILEKAGSGTTDVECSGFVTSYKTNLGGVKDKQTFSVTIQPTGPISKTATA
jgi:hypothetical protein